MPDTVLNTLEEVGELCWFAYFYSGLAKWLLGAKRELWEINLKFWGVIWPKDSLVLGWSVQKTFGLLAKPKNPKPETLSQLFGPKYWFIPKPDLLNWYRFFTNIPKLVLTQNKKHQGVI